MFAHFEKSPYRTDDVGWHSSFFYSRCPRICKAFSGSTLPEISLYLFFSKEKKKNKISFFARNKKGIIYFLFPDLFLCRSNLTHKKKVFFGAQQDVTFIPK